MTAEPPLHPTWDVLPPIARGRLVSVSGLCFTTSFLGCWAWRSPSTLSPGSVFIRAGDQVLFYVSPINSSLQHLGRRRKPQAVLWEVFGVVGVWPSPGTTRASPLGDEMCR